MLLERRRNSEVNPKTTIYKNLEYYYNLDIENNETKYFIHLTGDVDNEDQKSKVKRRSPYLPKFGINPRQNYNTTPFGIYVYPLKDSWWLYKIGTNRNLKGITFPFKEENRKYVYVLKIKSSINLLNVKTYTREQLEKDKKILNRLYDYDFSEEFEKPIFDNFKKEHLNFPYFKLKNITYNIAKKYSKNKIIITWNSIFRKLGYDGIYDPGIGLIDSSEKCQCVFLKKDVIEEKKLYENKNYEKIKTYARPSSKDEKMYFFNKKRFVGKMKDGILHFNNLDVSKMNIRSLKELPWANQPYAVLEQFDCSNNNLKNLEGGPVFANTYYCSNNELETLKGAPDKVVSITCSYNKKLKTLEGAPKECNKFYCNNCPIESLQYISDKITYLNCMDTKIVSLKYLPKTVTNLVCSSKLKLDFKPKN